MWETFELRYCALTSLLQLPLKKEKDCFSAFSSSKKALLLHWLPGLKLL